MTKNEELELKIWKGADRFAKKAWKGNWVNKKEWYDETDLASSIHGFVCKELKIGNFKKHETK